MAGSNERRVYHYDEAGNTLVLSNDAGQPAAAYSHSPFGQLLGSSGTADNPFTWQGERGVVDDGGGLFYKRARYYDAVAGRFISRDRGGSITPLELNPYQYARNNPLTFIDPDGLDVRISGYGRFGLDYNEAKASAPRKSETNITSRLRLKIDMSAETDSGVSFGARFRAKAEARRRQEAVTNLDVGSALDMTDALTISDKVYPHADYISSVEPATRPTRRTTARVKIIYNTGPFAGRCVYRSATLTRHPVTHQWVRDPTTEAMHNSGSTTACRPLGSSWSQDRVRRFGAGYRIDEYTGVTLDGVPEVGQIPGSNHGLGPDGFGRLEGAATGFNESIFADGFESGDTTAWSQTVD
jgi:RHS repeat-associated protein